MSSVHYKFKSSLDYDTLTFDGLSITLGELKKAIAAKKLGKNTDFDLQITNAQTKEGKAIIRLQRYSQSRRVQCVERAFKLSDGSIHGLCGGGGVGIFPFYRNRTSQNRETGSSVNSAVREGMVPTNTEKTREVFPVREKPGDFKMLP